MPSLRVVEMRVIHPEARQADRQARQAALKRCAGCGLLALALFREPSGWVCQACRHAARWRTHGR